MSDSKLREGLMLNFINEPGSFLAQKSGYAIQRSASFLKKLLVITLFCALSFMLSAPSLVQAEDLQEGTPAAQPSTNVQAVNTADPVGLITGAVPENRAAAKANTQANDDLELGPEIIGQPVQALRDPAVNAVSAGDKTVSGKITVGSGQRRTKKLDTIIHVIVNRQAGGTEEKTVAIPYNARPDWTVTLGSELVAGDKVTVKQEFDNEFSGDVVRDVKKGLNDQHKDDLKMPSGEIWIERTAPFNIVNEEEQAEALKLVKEANSAIAGDIKSVELKISGTSDAQRATINVTYTDGTTSGEIEAPGLIVKQVTETSTGAAISEITVVDNVIKGKLQGDGPFEDIKVQISTKLSETGIANFNSKTCTIDKDSQKPVEATVDSATGEFTYTIPSADGLPHNQVVGVSVKEKNKFVSCATSTVILATPQKTEVRDPKKLTADDKKAIEAAIRKANTTRNGLSKLPDGTGFLKDPAFIEFDKDGNVTVISPNNVDVEWKNSKPVYQKNDDGTYKVKDKSAVIKIPAKDLVKNLKPDSPQIAVNTDDGKVTITPPPYTEGKDTDLLSYTITYKDAAGNEKTATATRDLKTNKWSGSGVDEETGMITLSVEDIEVGGTITATAKDNGGLEGDTDKLDSDPASKQLETATVSYDRNGGTGDMEGKKLNKGSEYEILSNAFTAPENEKFKTWQIGTTEHKAGDKIRVKDDTTIQAIWQDIEVTVSYSPNGGSGSMDSATMKKGSKYTLLESTFKAPDDTQEFKAWAVDGQEVAPGTEITVTKDTEVKALWKKIKVQVTYDPNGGSGTMNAVTVDKGSNYTVLPNAFKAPDDTQEFKAWEVDGQEVAPGDKITVKDNTVVKAVWKKIQVKVTYEANGGDGTMEGKTLDKGSKYTLAANGFTAPKNQEFDTWEIDGNKVAAGTEITVNKNTTVKAIWKDSMVDITFGPGEGSGKMDKETVKKGSKFKLPDSKFEAPKNKEFKGWKIGEKEYQVGKEITVDGDTTVTAIWKDIEYQVTFDGNGGTGKMNKETVKKGDSFKLPPNGFTPPTGKEFNGWQIGDKTYKVDDSITVDGDVTVKALWKDKPVPPATTPGKDKPGDQVKPQPKPQKQNSVAAGNLSKTGATGMYSLYASLLLLATGGLFLISRRRRNQR